MRSIEQIIADNGYDNTPIGDSHNLTGRALPEGVEGDVTLREPEFPSGLAEDWDEIASFAPLERYPFAFGEDECE